MPTPALMNNFGTRALTLVRGEGSWVWDDRGRKYFDAVMGIAVCGLGHSHPAVKAAIIDQIETLDHCSNLYNIPAQEKLAETLTQVSGMERVFFGNSGTEVNEAAIKIARMAGHQKGYQVPHIICAQGAFHGRTLGALSATPGAKARDGFGPLLEGFSHVPYGDVDAIAAAATDSTIAVFVEPVQGEGGINIPPASYVRDLRALCDQNGWLLIFDEIQTGNGRTGSYFHYQQHNILPDIVTTAKGLGNGLPIGACMARGAAADLLGPGSHGSTYGGNPLVCRAALAVYETIASENLLENVKQMSAYLVTQLRQQLGNLSPVKEVRAAGLMMAVEMHCDCADLVALAAEQGLIINVTAGNRVRLVPALNISKDEADFLVSTLAKVVAQWQPAAEAKAS